MRPPRASKRFRASDTITPSIPRSEKFQSVMKLLWATMDSSARSWRQVFKVRSPRDASMRGLSRAHRARPHRVSRCSST